ncbi:MAG: WYL domain-containing protein, partial [Paludibacteraceae bacterium]|nr:WYL domain-containing protein [Paludibacteraceae bacterium]
MKQFSEDKVTIRIRVKRASVESMRSQPLHTSQREVEATDKYADFEYFVAPTAELYGKLLSYGSGIEVLDPREARLEMYNRIMNMSFIYSEEMARTKIGKAVIYATNKFPKANIARVRHSLEMQRGTGYIRRLDACMLYLEATQGWEYIKNFRLNDIDTLAVFQRGDTEGVYMCSSEEVRAKLREAEIGSI